MKKNVTSQAGKELTMEENLRNINIWGLLGCLYMGIPG